MMEKMIEEYVMDDNNKLSLMACLKWLASKGIVPDSEQIESISDYINDVRIELDVINTVKNHWHTKKAQKLMNQYGFIGLYF